MNINAKLSHVAVMATPEHMHLTTFTINNMQSCLSWQHKSSIKSSKVPTLLEIASWQLSFFIMYFKALQLSIDIEIV